MNKRIAGNWVLLVVVVAAFLLLGGAREFISFVVDLKFFREIGFEAVFTKTYTAKLLTGLAFGGITFFLVSINLLIAGKRKFPMSGMNVLLESVPQLARMDLTRLMGKISLLVSLAAFLFAVPVGMQYWERFLLFLNSTPAGLVDPLFGNDISFYLFQYPFIDSMNTMLRTVIVISAILTGMVYLLRGGVAVMGRRVDLDPAVKRHLGVLISLFLVSLSVSFVLDRYGLLFTEHGVLYGASYTDVHARLLMLTVMVALSLAAAIAVPVFAARGSLLLPLVALGALIGLSLLGLGVYPSMLQSFKVSPNEIVLERPYIADHIKFTRYGYGLENMGLQPFAANKQLTFADIRKNLATIQNIRLWDEEPLLKTYSQLKDLIGSGLSS